jgi:hypothetical protein
MHGGNTKLKLVFMFFFRRVLFVWRSAKHLSSTVRAAAAGFECGSPAVLMEQNAAQ